MNTAIIKPQWSPFTIALMVLGFIVFWPLGFVVLAYILWGEKFNNGGGFRPDRWMQQKQERWSRHCGQGFGFTSGNAAFDAYREEQLKRLEEERRKLDEEVVAFHEHMRNLRMARDREEFDRFMRDRNASRQGPGDNQGQNNGNQQGGGY
ncbi:MAG TPA: DUF2852 domain-containing protein [Arsenicitalea sp.]|jgi:hypothetical protein|nr:DUF2852 domain-containing protein [Arsenicitalea sp.]